jgi:hypothetical protein
VKKRLAMLVVLAAAIMLGLGLTPAGWKWGGKNDAKAGWSWNSEIASVNGDTVTLIGKNKNTLTLAPVDGAAPVVGDDVTVVQQGLIWDAENGGTVDQPLGWTWNG